MEDVKEQQSLVHNIEENIRSLYDEELDEENAAKLKRLKIEHQRYLNGVVKLTREANDWEQWQSDCERKYGKFNKGNLASKLLKAFYVFSFIEIVPPLKNQSMKR